MLRLAEEDPYLNIATRSWMDQKTQLKIEFFELCRLLNKSNLNANQKTDISFYFETEVDCTVLYATTNKRFKIQLISKITDDHWQASNFTNLFIFEKSVANLFDQYNSKWLKTSDLTALIKSFIFHNIDEL